MFIELFWDQTIIVPLVKVNVKNLILIKYTTEMNIILPDSKTNIVWIMEIQILTARLGEI